MNVYSVYYSVPVHCVQGHCTVYSVQCTLYSVHFNLQNIFIFLVKQCTSIWTWSDIFNFRILTSYLYESLLNLSALSWINWNHSLLQSVHHYSSKVSFIKYGQLLQAIAQISWVQHRLMKVSEEVSRWSIVFRELLLP